MLDEITKQTEMVLNSHVENLGVDWDEYMRGYAEDAVMIHPLGQLNGAAEIRAFFEGLPTELAASVRFHRQECRDDVGWIYWTAEPTILVGSDTFVLRDGKIFTQVTVFYPTNFY